MMRRQDRHGYNRRGLRKTTCSRKPRRIGMDCLSAKRGPSAKRRQPSVVNTRSSASTSRCKHRPHEHCLVTLAFGLSFSSSSIAMRRSLPAFLCRRFSLADYSGLCVERSAQASLGLGDIISRQRRCNEFFLAENDQQQRGGVFGIRPTPIDRL